MMMTMMLMLNKVIMMMMTDDDDDADYGYNDGYKYVCGHNDMQNDDDSQNLSY
jgi:hypothetical protein